MISTFLLFALGCSGSSDNDDPTDAGTDVTADTAETELPAAGGDWCAVQSIFAQHCLSCHGTASQLGDLDLQADPHGALVGVTSAATGAVLVQPGDPDGSLLVRKMNNTQAANEGGVMPLSGVLDPKSRAEVQQWVLEGAGDVCDKTLPTGETQVHPDGYVEAAVHGLDAKLQVEDCTVCHGTDFDGGKVGVSCTTCHDKTVQDWTTECTFCHGDPTTGVAAPPEDIDDNTDAATTSFPPHTVHVLGDAKDPLHAGWDCAECHTEPEDAFSNGHVFVGDTTPGVAEVTFTSPGARSPNAVYTPGKTCANVYCHGNGQPGGEGTIEVGADLVCGGCHPVSVGWFRMSGEHVGHMREGTRCEDCHTTGETTPEFRIVDFEQHINTTVETELPKGMTRNKSGQCTGTCHNEDHTNASW